MCNTRENGGRREEGGLVAVAVDRDKGSQYALKWAVDNMATRGQTLRLVHVHQKSPILRPLGGNELSTRRQPDNQTMEIFLPFRCFCMRSHQECEVVALEDQDIAKALVEYIYHYGVGALLLGAPKNGFSRLFKTADVPSLVTKLAPDFCNVYVISKGRIVTIRAASRPVPTMTLSRSILSHNLNHEAVSITSPLSRCRVSNNILHDELSELENDISLSSFRRASTDSMFLSFYENLGSELIKPSELLDMEDNNLEPRHSRSKSVDLMFPHKSLILQEKEDMEDKMRMLELELKQTVEMYNAACKEALAAKQKARELQEWKMEEEQRLEEAQLTEEAALAIVEEEKAKCMAAIEAVKEAQRMAELELQKRVNAEMKALREAEEKKKVLDALGHSNILVKYHSVFHFLTLLFLFIVLFFWN